MATLDKPLSFDLKEEHQLIIETVRDFAENEIKPNASRWDLEDITPRETFQKFAELGMMGISVPEEYGGGGADYLSFILMIEELAKYDGGFALSAAAHVSLGIGPLLKFGTEEQKQRYVPDLAVLNYFGCFGLTEPNAGSDAAGTQTMAVKHGDEWVINGSKQWITNSGFSGVCVFTAQTDRVNRRTETILPFLCAIPYEGFEVGKREEKLGCRSSDTHPLYFRDLRLRDEDLLGGMHEHGFRVFMNTLQAGRISIGAMAVGLAQGAMELAIEHARSRRQFDRPIGAFQGVSFSIADMAVQIEAARHLVYHAARLKQSGRPYAREAAMAKLFASEMAMTVTSAALQIYGGSGFSREYPLEWYYRDAKLTTIGEGTSEIQRIVLARELLGRLD